MSMNLFCRNGNAYYEIVCVNVPYSAAV